MQLFDETAAMEHPTEHASKPGASLRRSSSADSATAISVCTLLLVEPLLFGGVPQAAILLLELGLGLVFIFWAASQMFTPVQPMASSLLFAPTLLFAAVIAIQLLLNRSAYWYASWQKALLWAAYGILLFLGTQCFCSGRARWRFGLTVSVYGFVVSLFAIVQALAGNGKFYWLVTDQSGGSFFGSYANHAHYAGLMEMLVPFPLIIAMASFPSLPLRFFCGSAAVVMSSSIFLSQSRGGIFAFVVSLIFLMLVSAYRHRVKSQIKFLAVFSAVLVLWLMLVPPSGLWQSFLQADDPGPGRITIVHDSVRMLLHRPVLGWGFGTFSVVYPSFRSFYTDLSVNAAHNDYVEVATEAGLVGFALMLWFIYRLYRAGIALTKHWRHRPEATIALAALVGCTGLLAHGLMDFNLQVPANAAIFFLIAALATTQTGRRGSHPPDDLAESEEDPAA
jgi:O-antigen ligase